MISHTSHHDKVMFHSLNLFLILFISFIMYYLIYQPAHSLIDLFSSSEFSVLQFNASGVIGGIYPYKATIPDKTYFLVIC